jgi:prenyltransferase beta subunit
MRLSFALLVAFVPSVAFAQTKEIDDAIKRKLATAKWVTALQAPDGGFYLAPQDPKLDAAPKPMLRATNGAVRALKYLGVEIPSKDKHAAFVLKCHDPKTGAFAEPGGKPDVAITSIGVMVATELGIPKEKFAKAMDYLKANAKTFEEVRIGAAAVEAWGVKDCPFKLDDWMTVAGDYSRTTFKGPAPTADQAREFGSLLAFNLRLNPGEKFEPGNRAVVVAPLLAGQRADGGWGKAGEKASDIETTYRVMRALMLLKEKPKDVKKLREFLDAHRNTDGGYATKPGDKSSMSGVYYAVIVSKWLDEMK